MAIAKSAPSLSDFTDWTCKKCALVFPLRESVIRHLRTSSCGRELSNADQSKLVFSPSADAAAAKALQFIQQHSDPDPSPPPSSSSSSLGQDSSQVKLSKFFKATSLSVSSAQANIDSDVVSKSPPISKSKFLQAKLSSKTSSPTHHQQTLFPKLIPRSVSLSPQLPVPVPPVAKAPPKPKPSRTFNPAKGTMSVQQFWSKPKSQHSNS